MVPMSSTAPIKPGPIDLSPDDQAYLLDLAHDSIHYGVMHQRLMPLGMMQLPLLLQRPSATFVTLHCWNRLRGCIGTLEATRPLAEDIVCNAYAAAFEDPRFPPLTTRELNGLDIHISILTPSERMHFKSQEDLLAQLRPGIDGLVLVQDSLRGTFLPAVWKSLPNPRDFLRQLKRKAGLSEDYWSSTIEVYRYTTLSIPPVD